MLLSLVLAAQLAQAAAPARAFEVRALGVLGGDDDSNLTSFLVRREGDPSWLMLDAGSVREGLVAWRRQEGRAATVATPEQRAEALRGLLRQTSALLVTHAHLDHVASLLLLSPLLTDGKGTLEVYALPETIAALAQSGFAPPLWADLTHVPPQAPAVALHPIEGPTRLGGLEVTAIPLAHPVPSAAFLLRDPETNASYLHLGDTGPTEAVWAQARAPLAAGTLHAIAVEVSFASGKEKLAALTGHLTPRMLLVELNKLARVEEKPLEAASLSADEAVALARKLGPALGRCKLLAIHLKAQDHRAVADELRRYAKAGLPIVLPEQGSGHRF